MSGHKKKIPSEEKAAWYGSPGDVQVITVIIIITIVTIIIIIIIVTIIIIIILIYRNLCNAHVSIFR
jgi:hypothetical protein